MEFFEVKPIFHNGSQNPKNAPDSVPEISITSAVTSPSLITKVFVLLWDDHLNSFIFSLLKKIQNHSKKNEGFERLQSTYFK